MKLVYIYHSLAYKGGLERIFCDKMNYLVRKCSYDITFITYEQGNHPLSYTLDDRIKVIDLDTRFVTLFKYNVLLRFFKSISLKRLLKKRLAETLKNEKPDIVVCATYEFYISECILDLPYNFIVESHLCMNAVLSSRLHNNFLVSSVAKLFDLWHFSKINKAKMLVTLTEADKKDWGKHVSTDIMVIPNMVTWYPDIITPYNERPKRIICAGRLDKQKGFDYLIEAWALIAKKYPDWKIDIFGHGDLKDALNKMIANRKLENQMEIHNPTDRIYDEYMNSSIYVMSSRYEGFGLVLIEAMSCGVPCISFDCPHGPSEIISHGEDGIIVPLGNISELAKSIEWMITNKRGREAMSIAARTNARRYQENAIMPRWIELFNKIN